MTSIVRFALGLCAFAFLTYSAVPGLLKHFTFANWGGESVAFVRPTKDPSVITLRSAADGLFGRWMFFLVLVALGAVLALTGLARPRVRRADPAFT